MKDFDLVRAVSSSELRIPRLGVSGHAGGGVALDDLNSSETAFPAKPPERPVDSMTPRFYVKTDDGFRPATDAEIVAYALDVDVTGDAADVSLNTAKSDRLDQRAAFIYAMQFRSERGGAVTVKRTDRPDVIFEACVAPGVTSTWNTFSFFSAPHDIVLPARELLDISGPPDLRWSVSWRDGSGRSHEDAFIPATTSEA